MLPARTRNRIHAHHEMDTGIFRLPIHRWLALAILALAACASAQAAGNAAVPYAIRLQQASAAVAGWTLAIDGEWATQCPPALESVGLDGNDLRIDARSALGLCARQATPYSIEVNPTLALNRPNLTPGIYHVSFYAADGAQARPKLRAFALVDRSLPDASSITPETGFWWSTQSGTAETDRSILSLELQNGQLSVALLSYDTAGQPTWYFGAGPFAGRTAHVPLLRLAGGSDPFSPVATNLHGEPALTLDLQFASSAHAAAWLGRSEGSVDDSSLRLQPMDLVRLPLAESADGGAWQGDWVLVKDAGGTPQRLRLDRFQTLDANHFQLDDSANGFSLACTRDATRPDLPPSSCSLHQADGSESAVFDSVAIARMDGVAVHLLRISP
jgi:hypothetical protein